jgi:hypothetical protein
MFRASHVLFRVVYDSCLITVFFVAGYTVIDTGNSELLVRFLDN